MTILVRWLALVVAGAIASETQAQGCCTVGASTLGGLEHGLQPYRTLSVGINYQYNSLTTAFQGRERIDDPLRRAADVGYFSLSLEYGLQPRLSVLMIASYSGKARELTVESEEGGNGFPETVRFSSSGIGDLQVVAKYDLLMPTITSPWEIAIGAGAGLPTGSATREQDGARLSADLQPGSGAPSLMGWWFAMRSLPDCGLRIVTSGTYRYAGTNLDGYRTGDEIVLLAGAEYDLSGYIGSSLVARARFARKDFAGRRVLSATGGSYVDLVPALTYAGGPSAARFFSHIPLYRNINGIQLTLTYLIGLEYRYTFDFRDVVDVLIPQLS